MASLSYFNSEQRGEMDRLSRADPKTLCLCGWWDHGKCDHCPPKFTHADRLAEKCKECGGYPGRPGEKVGHTIACSKRTDPFIDETKSGIFRDHSCYRCNSGALPCIKGKGRERDCDTLHARND